MSRRFQVIHCDQRTPEWFAARAGRLTGSVADAVYGMPNARSKNSPEIDADETEARRKLRKRIAIERMTGNSFEAQFSSKSTKQGIEREPLAVYEFEKARNECVMPSGFIAHADMLAGCSLDGYIGDFTETVGVKCFEWEHHLECVLSPELERDILAQGLHEMWLTGAKRHHFVFWNPDMPAHLRLHIRTLDRKDKETAKLIGTYSGRAEVFLEDVDKTVAYLLNVGANQPEAAAASSPHQTQGNV